MSGENSTKTPKAAENNVEKQEKRILENVRDLKWKSNLMGLLKVARLVTLAFRERPRVSDSIKRWANALVLAAHIFFQVFKLSNTTKDYLKTERINEKLGNAVKETLESVDGLMESCEDYLRNLERIYKDLSLADDRDGRLVLYLVREFDYYVRQMLTVVELVEKNFELVKATFNKVYDDLEANQDCRWYPSEALAIPYGVGGTLALIGKAFSRTMDNRRTRMIKTKDLLAKLSKNWAVTSSGNVVRVEFIVERLKNDGSFHSR